MHALVSTLNVQVGDPLYIFGILTLFSSLSSLVLCPADSSFLDISELWPFSTPGVCWAMPGFSLPASWLGNSLQAINCHSCWAHLVCFPFLRGHGPLLDA